MKALVGLIALVALAISSLVVLSNRTTVRFDPVPASVGLATPVKVEAANPHGVRVDMSVFDGVAYPLKPLERGAPPDLRPRARSKVVDAGLRIPNVNDGFRGKAPDIGAYEAGEPLPLYGPRPRSAGQ